MPINRIESGVAPSKSRIITKGGTYSGDIAVAGYSLLTLTPPVGVIWEINQMLLEVAKPAGAASGTHDFKVMCSSLVVMSGASVYGSALNWDYNMWIKADSVQKPATEVGALLALSHIIYDNENPLDVMYQNSTDVVQANDRIIKFNIKETPII